MDRHINYMANTERYNIMPYRRCGNSGLLLPAISLGLWHNFGHNSNFEASTKLLLQAFDWGITHFDLANNYGPPTGSAEENFGNILQNELKPYRDELIISTKAGYDMWDGPYGTWNSRKHIIASCNQSLKRLKLEYVDIFYSHRADPYTPIEETMMALDSIIKSGKALYAGISRYNIAQTDKAIKVLKELGTPFVIHQEKYSMLNREPEEGILELLKNKRIGSIVFSPLAQGQLSNKYIDGIPANSRAADNSSPFLQPGQINEELRKKLTQLNIIAKNRNQTISQMALAWILRRSEITSVLIGARNTQQLKENIGCLNNTQFNTNELTDIDKILSGDNMV